MASRTTDIRERNVFLAIVGCHVLGCHSGGTVVNGTGLWGVTKGLRTELGLLLDLLSRPRTVTHTTHLVTGWTWKDWVRESFLTWFQEKLSAHKPSKASHDPFPMGLTDSSPSPPSHVQVSLSDSLI